MTGRAVGVAPVRRAPLAAAELAAALATWRYIDAARLDARSGDAYGYSAQARHDVEVLGAALADALFLHEPRDGSPLCPACSAPGCPRVWPCRTWRRIMVHFGARG